LKSLATIALLFFTGILLAQPNLEWSKNYGGSGDDIADQILTTSNGYFISGSTTSQDGDFVDNPYDTAHFILKLDHQGLINWIHFYHEEVISIALDQKENLIFLKELDLSTIHLEKIDHQGVTIYNDQIISVNRTVIPIDLAMHSENEIKIIGNLASGFSQDGVFSCIYNEQNRNTEFIYQPRYYTGGINNFINYYIGIEEFFNTEMVVGFVWFDRAQTATLFPRKLEEICNFGNSHSLAFDMEVVASSDGSILVGCDELLKVYQDTIYSIGFNGPKKPLAGNKRYNWVYQQFDDDFLILAVNNEGDSLYTLNYNGSEIDQILDAAIATDEGLVLF
jgi:hypothetical protein